MVKVIRTNKSDSFCYVGIHLKSPTKHEIENAVEDAENKNFPAVYIHTKVPKKGICKK